MVIILVTYIVQGIIFGIATNKIIENKGYSNNWFWWGFFFGIIALLVSLSKPINNVEQNKDDFWYDTLQSARKNKTLKEGGWECAFCHTVNENYVSICSCGKTKKDTEQNIKEKESNTELDTIELIKKYKELLDSGIITQEEFDKKKQSLL